MLTERSSPAGRWQLPTLHVVRAALHVASLIDESGSRLRDAHESYWRHATGGVFPPPDLKMGERLLVACGLVEELDGILYPTDDLEDLLGGTLENAAASISFRVLAGQMDITSGVFVEEVDLDTLVEDPSRREEILLALGQRWDDAHRRLVGEIGEELVVAASKFELDALGYPNLAREVRRVSLESDQLGYDITAPRIGGPPRLLEVKASASEREDSVSVFISRNELDTGVRFTDWSLVVCRVQDIADRRGELLGWCSAADIARVLPADGTSARWEVASVQLSRSSLHAGLPRAVL